MGSPKALLRYRGETFLDRAIGLVGACCAPVIVVLGAAAGEIRAQAVRPALFVVNPDYQSGQTSSMQAGLRAVPADSTGVLFTLVDHPAVAPETLDIILAGGGGAPLRIPRYRGRRGHPIWFAGSLIAEFMALPAASSAREVVTRHAGEIAYIEVDDPGVVLDVDERADYQRLVALP